MRTLKDFIESMAESDLANDYELDRYIFDAFGSDDLMTFCNADNSTIVAALLDTGWLDEQIERSIDAYYYDQRKWSVENYDYIEDAISEGLCEEQTDFHSFIQAGQRFYHTEELHRQLDVLIKNIKGAIKFDENNSKKLPTTGA